MRMRLRAVVLVCTALLLACGGGGGSSAPAGTQPPLSAYPTLVESGSFSLPALAAPPERAVTAGIQQGRVLVAPGVSAPAGLTVAWLDASSPGAPIVIATAATQADGTFSIAGTPTGAAPIDQWLRVSLADGTTMRAYATGWVELTPATEAAVRELSRLRTAGAFSAHVLAQSELAGAQQSLTLAWQGSGDTSPPASAADAIVQGLYFFAPWNQLLDKFALATVSQGAGDIAGLMPVGNVQWPSSVFRDGATTSTPATFQSNCFAASIPDELDCSIASTSAADLYEGIRVRRTEIGRNPPGDTSNLSELLSQLGELPLLEFPYAPGTQVLVDQPQIVLGFDSNVHASAKITRRTYPAEALQALGGTVQAVKVVLDFEIALLDTTTQQQSDWLWRETRWFSPGNGRVRYESSTSTRTAPQASIASAATPVTTSALTAVANSVSGSFFAAPVVPFAGVADVTSLALRHRHAVYSAALDRIYVATATGGGQILELDPATLATLRTLDTGAVPGRLAVSSDGTLLYAGLDGGVLAEWRIADFSLVSQTTVPTDPYGEQYSRIYDLAIDPFDSARVLLLAGGNSYGNSGALLVYRQGVLVLRDAPRYYATDYGWGYYSPNAIAWTTVRDEYIAASFSSPESAYRFHVDETAGATTEVSSLLRVGDLGWVDVAGSVLTSKGKSLDALTFAPQGSLSLGTLSLTGCNRQDASTDLCQTGNPAAAPPVFARLDHATSAFLGTYQPQITTISDGCGNGVRQGSLGLDDLTLTPMTTSRVLVSALAMGDADETCSLQVWALHGVN